MLPSHYKYAYHHFDLFKHKYVFMFELKKFIVSELVIHKDANESFSIGTPQGEALFINFESTDRATEILKFLQTTEILFI